ncbi:MAG: asparagine synthase (glutamine-hydrolyzing), partial [Bacteroidia bacterium]
MCGIAGQYFLNKERSSIRSGEVINALKHRGPDHQQLHAWESCTLFHARLSIIDLSGHSHQPFLNETETKGLVYNGEIFNYKTLSSELDMKGEGDVEVLFRLFERKNTDCLHELNGFFAFSFYDSIADELVVARDRYGEKPLYYFQDENMVCFASELKALMLLCGPQPLNEEALYTYFRLNYISGRETIFKNVFRLQSGEYIRIKHKNVSVQRWYSLPVSPEKKPVTELLSDAVKIRLHADVPVGCFLSGGLDSSIISALAKQHHNDLHTFSLGFEDEPYFDETAYAEQVAKHIRSKHHVFKLKNTDLLENIDPFLNSIDEPFADSSAFNVFVLSKYTRQQVKVALSGDGADELFMGYNKHRAELLSRKFLYGKLVPAFNPLIRNLPSSRNSRFGNTLRQLKRFAASGGQNAAERYKDWACISQDTEVRQLLKHPVQANAFHHLFSEAFSQQDFFPVNYADLKIVLSDDMLVKADRM